MKKLLFAISIFSAVSCWAQTGSISGTVRTAGALAIESTVFLATASGDYVYQVDTNPATGAYSFTSLFNGEYRLYTLYSSRGATTYIDELYNNNVCVLGICDLTAGTPVTVVGGGAVNNINFVLSPAGSINGTVSGPSGGEQVALYIYNASGTELNFFSSEPNGTYSIGGLATGNYFLITHNEAGLVDERYNNSICPGLACVPENGTPIAVTAGVATNGINFTLAAGGSFSGLVQNYTGSKTIDGAQIKLYNSAGALIETRSSSFDGTFETATGLPSGNYFITAEKQSYVRELYSDIDCVTSCDVTDGLALNPSDSAVNFSLTPEYELTARVRTRNLRPKQMAKVFVKNEGLKAAGPFVVRIYQSETNPKAYTAVLLKEETVNSLAANTEQLFKVKRQKIGKNKFIVVEVDADTDVTEGDETNNIKGKKIIKLVS